VAHNVERKTSSERRGTYRIEQRWFSATRLAVALIGISTIGSPIQTEAHSDPLGDVYPNVQVRNGNFVIDFDNNDNKSDNHDARVFRIIYAPDGTLLAPRHMHGGKRSLQDVIGEVAKNTVRVGDELLEFSQERRSGQPAYTITKNGNKESRRLAWPENYECAFEAAAADDRTICIASVTNQMLFLSYFDRSHSSAPETVQVTKKDELPFIWDFPVVSNLIQIGRRYCIAWPRFNTKSEKFECVISTWKPGEKQPKEIVLDQPADWNSHLSLAKIGNKLCLAYHCLAGDDYLDRSRIITVFQTIGDD
jgi:hypothetical protein